MKQICKFNSDTDIQNVIPNLSLDITEAAQTGVVDNSNINGDFNQISDCNEIGSRIEDNFDVYNRQKQIAATLDKAQSTQAAQAAQTANKVA